MSDNWFYSGPQPFRCYLKLCPFMAMFCPSLLFSLQAYTTILVFTSLTSNPAWMADFSMLRKYSFTSTIDFPIMLRSSSYPQSCLDLLTIIASASVCEFLTPYSSARLNDLSGTLLILVVSVGTNVWYTPSFYWYACQKSMNSWYKLTSCSQRFSVIRLTVCSWSSVDLPGLKPSWYSPKLASEYASSLFFIMLDDTLYATHNRSFLDGFRI